MTDAIVLEVITSCDPAEEKYHCDAENYKQDDEPR